MKTEALAITIYANDEEAKHVLLNAGILHFLDPQFSDARANCSLYWQTNVNGQHIAGAHFYRRSDGDNGYVAIVAPAAAMAAADFVSCVSDITTQPGNHLHVVRGDEVDRHVRNRLSRQ